MTKSCILCVDDRMRTVVEGLTTEAGLTDIDSIILSYLMRHQDTYIDGRELKMIIIAMLEDHPPQKIDILQQVHELRSSLVCKLGINLIDFDADQGFKISNACSLLHKS